MAIKVIYVYLYLTGARVDLSTSRYISTQMCLKQIKASAVCFIESFYLIIETHTHTKKHPIKQLIKINLLPNKSPINAIQVWESHKCSLSCLFIRFVSTLFFSSSKKVSFNDFYSFWSFVLYPFLSTQPPRPTQDFNISRVFLLEAIFSGVCAVRM